MNSMNKWGLSPQLWKGLYRVKNKTYSPPYLADSAKYCTLGPGYWKNYKTEEYNYQFNDWGFRDQNFEQFQGQSVNICIGDSLTMNIGGPEHHSWPRLLSRHFDTPTFNVGINNLNYYSIQQIVDKAREFFNVDKIFILYNIWDNDEPTSNTIVPVYVHRSIDDRIKAFKQYCFVLGAYYQFDPPWTFFDDELKYLLVHFPEAHDYLKSFVFDWREIPIEAALASEVLQKEYAKIAKNDWISYSDFCQRMIYSSANILELYPKHSDQILINDFISRYFSKLLTCNRDGWHMSLRANQCLADYFIKKVRQGSM